MAQFQSVSIVNIDAYSRKERKRLRRRLRRERRRIRKLAKHTGGSC